MEGYVGQAFIKRRATDVRKPIGFFGIAVVLAKVPNLFIRVLDTTGHGVANCVVLCHNQSSGVPFSASTDNNGNVGLVADGITTITFTNNKTSYEMEFNRLELGGRFNYVLEAQPLY